MHYPESGTSNMSYQTCAGPYRQSATFGFESPDSLFSGSFSLASSFISRSNRSSSSTASKSCVGSGPKFNVKPFSFRSTRSSVSLVESEPSRCYLKWTQTLINELQPSICKYMPYASFTRLLAFASPSANAAPYLWQTRWFAWTKKTRKTQHFIGTKVWK